MIQVTKIFRFETAHAIHGYDGLCKNVHGHSYVLHVTVSNQSAVSFPLPEPGFVIDFKELKKIVKEEIEDYFDHRLVISKSYLDAHPYLKDCSNLEVWDYEPSAENILYFIQQKINPLFPENIKLERMKIFETANSYAEWTAL